MYRLQENRAGVLDGAIDRSLGGLLRQSMLLALRAKPSDMRLAHAAYKKCSTLVTLTAMLMR